MIRSMYRQIWSALKTRSYDAFNFVCAFNPVCFEHQPEVGYDENSIKGRIGRSLGDLTFVQAQTKIEDTYEDRQRE